MPSQCETVHGLLDPPLPVDDPCVVGEEEVKKLLTLLIPFQGIHRETFAAMVVEVRPA